MTADKPMKGHLALWCIFPHRLKLKSSGENLYFAAAYLCGVTLYYLLENIALTFTLASNVGVIISVAPSLQPSSAPCS